MYVYSVSPCHAQRRGFKNLRWERGRVGEVGEWASGRRGRRGRVGEWASGRVVGVCFCGNFSNGAVTEAGAGDEHPRAAFATSTWLQKAVNLRLLTCWGRIHVFAGCYMDPVLASFISFSKQSRCSLCSKFGQKLWLAVLKGPACPWSRLLKQTWSLIQAAALIFSSKPGDEAIDSNRMRKGYLQSFCYFITLLAALRERMLWQTELSFRVDKPRCSKFDAWGDRFVRNIELWLWEHRRGTRPHGEALAFPPSAAWVW